MKILIFIKTSHFLNKQNNLNVLKTISNFFRLIADSGERKSYSLPKFFV